MAEPSEPKSALIDLNETFMGMLVADVIAAEQSLAANDNQTLRRSLIRTQFAAIEGIAWMYRENVVSAARALDELTPFMELVFAETTYTVTETGKVLRQPKYVSLTAMIRLTTNLAQLLSPDLSVNFSSEGWASLKKAIKVRNRLVHPKSTTDLIVGSSDIDGSWSALLWLSDVTEKAAAATLQSQVSYLKSLRVFVADLKRGDPATLLLYEKARASEE